MSKYIDVVFMAPPTLETPVLVGVEDATGKQLTVGHWLAPTSESPFWRLRFTVAEMLMQMIAPEEAEALQLAETGIGLAAPGRAPASTAADAARAAKDRLRSKLPQRQRPQRPPAAKPAVDEAELDTTPDPGDLEADPDEGGFDPSAVPDDPKLARAIARANELEGAEAPPFASRLFDNQFHGKGGQTSSDEDDDS